MTRTFLSVTLSDIGRLQRNEWELGDDDGDLLTWLQREVKGFIELVPLARDLHVWVNDEGMYRCMRNPWLEAFARPYGWGHTRLFGHAVFTGGTSNQGDTLPLTEEQVAEILTWPGWPRPIEETRPL